MDTIFLHDLSMDTLIGVYDWERLQTQTLIFDVDIGTQLGTAAKSDDINDTIDYAQVVDSLRQALKEQQFLLLEAVAEFVAYFIIDKFDVARVRVKVIKPGILAGVGKVGVEIERHRS